MLFVAVQRKSCSLDTLDGTIVSAVFFFGGGNNVIRIPIADKFVYLGIVLSYGAFGMQSAMHRAEKANQNFGSLRNVLRANGSLNKGQRMQIYKTSILPSLLYGISAVGINASGLQALNSTVAQHLDKVLRLYDRGTSNAAVLGSVGLDLAEFLCVRATDQQYRIRSRQSPGLEAQRSEQVLLQFHTVTQPETTSVLHAVVAEQTPKAACPVCGLEFAGDHGVQMHIKAEHPELNQESKVASVRSKNSLFVLSFCRFC